MHELSSFYTAVTAALLLVIAIDLILAFIFRGNERIYPRANQGILPRPQPA